MSRQLIIVSSITYAMKAKSILKNKGIYVDITKTSKHSVQQGCGYGLILSKNVDRAVEILKENGINILGIKDDGSEYK
ncbi:MAG: DUF3343 domain-containing protein [Acutalibacteraceae bacterium]|nr:DUF3343 domain-containing protein [Acutalibacteraceae bacterium]